MSVRVRFAPSPTGRLHVGNVRAAVLNWLFARKSGGSFLLRLDDTDRERSTEAFARGIEVDLAWLGLAHDAFARQSDRAETYRAAAETLTASGRLYPANETPEELDKRRARQRARGLPPVYDRAALALSGEERARLEADYAKNRSVFKPDYPAMVQARAQIAELDGRIKTEVNNILSSIQGGKADTVQTVSRPAVESAELQFTHPAAGDTIAVFDTSAGVFKAVLFSTEAPQAVQNFTTLAQQGFYNGLTVTRAEKDFVVEAGQGADGKGTTIWNGNRFSAETTDKLHHYSGALCAAADASGDCASVFYIMETLPGSSSVTQELIDQMNAAGWRADVVSAYQTAGGAPYLDYTDTVFGQVYEGMEVVDTIAQTGVDETQRPTEAVTINSVTITKFE